MISNRKLLILPITILVLIVATFVQGGEWVRPFGNTSINIVVQNITASADVEGWTVLGNFLFNDTFGTLVGIGTSTPDFELDVIGVINGSNFTGSTNCAKIFGGVDSDFCVDGGGEGGVEWQTGTSILFNDTIGVNVGIGTNSPSQTLDVNGSVVIRDNFNVSGITNLDDPVFVNADFNVSSDMFVDKDFKANGDGFVGGDLTVIGDLIGGSPIKIRDGFVITNVSRNSTVQNIDVNGTLNVIDGLSGITASIKVNALGCLVITGGSAGGTIEVC